MTYLFAHLFCICCYRV